MPNGHIQAVGHRRRRPPAVPVPPGVAPAARRGQARPRPRGRRPAAAAPARSWPGTSPCRACPGSGRSPPPSACSTSACSASAARSTPRRTTATGWRRSASSTCASTATPSCSTTRRSRARSGWSPSPTTPSVPPWSSCAGDGGAGPSCWRSVTAAGGADVSSIDINAYVKEVVGGEVSAKDFRTWHGTVLAAIALAGRAGDAASHDRAQAGRARGHRRGRRAPRQHPDGGARLLRRPPGGRPVRGRRHHRPDAAPPRRRADGPDAARERVERAVLRMLTDVRPTIRRRLTGTNRARGTTRALPHLRCPGRPRRRRGRPRRRRARRRLPPRLALAGARRRRPRHRRRAAVRQGVRHRHVRHQRQAGAAGRHRRRCWPCTPPRIGIVALRHRLAVGLAGVALFGLVGVWAASSRRASAPWHVVAPQRDRGGRRASPRLWAVDRAAATGRRPRRPEATADRPARASSSGAGALLGRPRRRRRPSSAPLGRRLGGRFTAGESRAAVRLPRPAEPLAALTDGVQVDVPGMTPFITPNADFYRDRHRADGAAGPDRRLRAACHRDGRRRARRCRYDDLLARPLIERDITLTCVSNEVGGRYVGTARWLGVRLDDLLADAGIRPGADQIVGRSVDGFACGFPVETMRDGRDAMVAVGMNGEPLPIEHGFPARLIVPGLYGFVSATKWLHRDRADDVRRLRPLLAAARLGAAGADQADEPHRHASRAWPRSRPGVVPIAGVAWAQTIGIGAVEVQIDDGPWQPAELAAAPERRHVAAVGAALGCHAGSPHRAGAGHRRHRRNPDRGACRTNSRRCRRTSPDRRDRRVSRTAP